MQVGDDGRVLGLSIFPEEDFPVKVGEEVFEGLEHPFDDYLYVDGELVYDERPEHAEERGRAEAGAGRADRVAELEAAVAEQSRQIAALLDMLGIDDASGVRGED